MIMTAQNDLIDLREKAGWKAWDEFQFGVFIVDDSGWTYTEPDDVRAEWAEWHKLFYYLDDENDKKPSKTATFVVRFKINSDEVIESYVSGW